MLPPELPLPSQTNPNPIGPNGNPLLKIETEEDEYYCEIKNHKKNGKGLWESIKYNQCYFGDWADDKKHGKGVYLYNNGDLFVGEWNQDAMSGNGRYFNSYDGSVVEGRLWNNIKIDHQTETLN